ncbi:hypothetical protein Ddye_000295 [Dipteronia dyeriana]|uniref:DUF4283 domain-containing protein n=1 Tax=Dipteronia dyeriana TaxID=168575 RepID=A0AAE0CSE7_9ROSI|nr:hypothetical protein Ddye_000295 [Dipteronia dyeriana]
MLDLHLLWPPDNPPSPPRCPYATDPPAVNPQAQKSVQLPASIHVDISNVENLAPQAEAAIQNTTNSATTKSYAAAVQGPTLINQDDKDRVWAMGVCNIKPGILRLQPWQPNFNPHKQKLTTAQVWVRFYELGWEFWHPNILYTIARSIGIPLKIDKNTLDGQLNHYARVLIDIDHATPLEDTLMVELGDTYVFISLMYEKQSEFCASCSSVGHNKGPSKTDTAGKVDPDPKEKPKVCQEYRVKDCLTRVINDMKWNKMLRKLLKPLLQRTKIFLT